jgi:hypothetical protein
VTAASGAALATNAERSPALRGAGKRAATLKSADTLSAADLATPWRGRQTKSGA